jgi:hypothetical protein
MPITYLLVDFENVQPTAADVALVRGDHYRFWVFRGPHQNKFDAAMVEAWQPLGDKVRFVRSSKAGKNALDFHIAFCMGGLVQEHAAAGLATGANPRFIVISNDGGFDALFDLVRTLGFTAAKAASIPEALGIAAAGTPGQTKPSLTTPSIVAPASASPAMPAPTATKAPQKASASAQKHAPAKPTAKKAAKTVSADEAFTKLVDHLRAHPKNRPTTRKALERHIPSVIGATVAADVARALISRLESEGVATISDKEIQYKIPKSKKSA